MFSFTLFTFTFKYVDTAVSRIFLWFYDNFDLVNILIRCLKNSRPVETKQSMEYGQQTVEKAVPHKVQERDVFLQLCACMQEQGGGNLSIPCDASRREYMFRLKLSFNTILRGYNADIATSFEYLPIINCNYCLWRKMDQILYIY